MFYLLLRPGRVTGLGKMEWLGEFSERAGKSALWDEGGVKRVAKKHETKIETTTTNHDK